MYKCINIDLCIGTHINNYNATSDSAKSVLLFPRIARRKDIIFLFFFFLRRQNAFSCTFDKRDLTFLQPSLSFGQEISWLRPSSAKTGRKFRSLV